MVTRVEITPPSPSYMEPNDDELAEIEENKQREPEVLHLIIRPENPGKPRNSEEPKPPSPITAPAPPREAWA